MINHLPFDTSDVHESSSDELEELAAAFSLEALTTEEWNAFRTHLEGCGLCRRIVTQFQHVADLLPNALEEVSPSPGLKERILSKARGGVEGETHDASVLIEEERRIKRGWQRPSWLTLNPVAVAIALVLVLVGMVAWNVSLQLGGDDDDNLTTAQRELIEAIAQGGGITQLSGTEAAPEASGSLVQGPKGEKAFLLVHNLPRLASDREFQAWLIVGEIPSSAGTFASDALDQPVVLFRDFSDADAIGVSIEPVGGSPAPTGAIVLLGTP